MNVQIVSIHAALAGRPSILWHGSVDPKDLGIENGYAAAMAQPQKVNEALFRFFNRVDEDDVERLKDIGFELPSLSVGDIVCWGSKTYRIAGVGFDTITDSSDYAMALTAYTLRGALEAPEDDEEEETS